MDKNELYKIGSDFKQNREKYKTLLNKEPTWENLNIYYGMPFSSGENYRSFVKKRQQKDGTLKKQEVVKDTNIENKLKPEDTYKTVTEINRDGTQTSDKLISMSEKDSKDVNFLLKAHGFDNLAWELVSARNNIWNSFSKETGVLTLYSSKIVVKPRAEYLWNEEDIQKMFNSLQTDYKNKVDIYPVQFKQYGDLLVVPIADLHYNLLSEKYSTGNDYNLEIAENVFYYTLKDVISRVSNKTFEKVLFVVGNDFINADNLNGTTQKGTPQDNSSLWFNVVNKATQLIINGTDMLTTIAPVDIVYVPSNHDLHTMFGIMQTIKAWYRNDSNVDVDDNPLPRKYYKFGDTLIALSHDMKTKDTLQIITSEAKNLWSDCEHVICMLAHLHQAMVYEKQGYLEIMRLPTLSGWSRWSNQMGYIQSEKKNQSFIISRDKGITDILNTVIK